MPNQQGGAGLRRGIDDDTAFLTAGSQRFLDEEVHSGMSSSQGRLNVSLIRRSDYQGIESRFSRNHRFDIRISACTPIRRRRRPAGRIEIRNRRFMHTQKEKSVWVSVLEVGHSFHSKPALNEIAFAIVRRVHRFPDYSGLQLPSSSLGRTPGH